MEEEGTEDGEALRHALLQQFHFDDDFILLSFVLASSKALK
jgi:hypothetical protein